MITPDNITELKPGEIFVFGSNVDGVHGAGAARTAFDKFGAVWGIGEGLTGLTYAFPTLDGPSELGLRQRSTRALERSRDKFYKVVKENPDKLFYLTKVGCGLGGYDELYMQMFFIEDVDNLAKPEGW